jgi:hypothetical protein
VTLNSLTPDSIEVGTFLTTMSAALLATWAAEGISPPLLERAGLMLMAVAGVLGLCVGWLIRHGHRVKGKSDQTGKAHPVN